MMPNGRGREPPATGERDVVNAANVDAGHEELRPLMFSIAYRMTGSVGDAKDP